MKENVYFWIVLGVILMTAEVITPGTFLIFFGVSALLVGILTLFLPLPGTIELLLFALLSVVTLVTMRKHLKKLFSGKSQDAEGIDDSLKGRRAEVVERIAAPKPGKVELDGVLWSAISDEVLEPGDTVVIAEHESLTLKVERPV